MTTLSGPATDLQAWVAYYDRLEAAGRALAERMVVGAAFPEPAWELVPPPAGELPAGLVERHERVLGQLTLLTRGADARLAGLRHELEALPHHAPPRDAGSTGVGRSLDVFG
jgi:hypothetical protein